MNRFHNIAVLVLLQTIFICAQSIDYPNVNKMMNDFSKSAVYIETPQGSGTGTFFGVPTNDTSETVIVYVATAKHVLNKVDSLNRVIGSFDTVKVYMNVRAQKKESRLYSSIFKSNALDIAILTPIETKRSFREYDAFTPSINDIAEYNEVKKALSVFIAGYPFGIGTEHSLLDPVLQSGIVSLVDSVKSRVLIDIPVNLGNSGCPVYILTTNGATKLLGLVFEYEPSKADFVFRPSIQQPVPVNTSLGRVVIMQTIIEELKKLPH